MRADLESVQAVVLAGERASAVESRLLDLPCRVASIAGSEHEAEHAIRTNRPEVLICEAGFISEGFLERVRREDASCVVIGWLLTASSSAVADLLALGVDEVVQEGMGQRELGARIAATVRRSWIRPSRPLQLGALRIDDVNGEAEWAGCDLRLTRREREVLAALAGSAGRTMPREVLYKRVWGYAMARGDRSVDVNVKRLRAKLANAGTELAIKTQPGTGYRLELVEEREPTANAVTVL